ncbi:MAG TPA: hypothetical protein VGM56_18025 [Byssovorax sp.]|jgi:hypothetical protein
MDADRLVRRLKERCGPLPTCTEQQVRAAETDLGLRLPPLLRALYIGVGNGGFGPGCRALRTSAAELAEPNGWESVVQIARINDAPPLDDEPWPEDLLDICAWGCGISSAVDLQCDELRVVRFDPGHDGRLTPRQRDALRGLLAFTPPERRVTLETEATFLIEAPSLHAWLERWLSGENLSLWRPGAPPPRVT